VSLALLYDYSKLDYKVISFDDQLKWLTPEQEASALISTGGNIYIQIGYGCSFDSLRINSAPLRLSEKSVAKQITTIYGVHNE
jgi:hypothetical protein